MPLCCILIRVWDPPKSVSPLAQTLVPVTTHLKKYISLLSDRESTFEWFPAPHLNSSQNTDFPLQILPLFDKDSNAKYPYLITVRGHLYFIFLGYFICRVFSGIIREFDEWFDLIFAHVSLYVSSTVLMAGFLWSWGPSQNLHRRAESFIQTSPSESQLSK